MILETDGGYAGRTLERFYTFVEADVFNYGGARRAGEPEDGMPLADREAIARVVAIESAFGHIPRDDSIAIGGPFDGRRRHL